MQQSVTLDINDLDEVLHRLSPLVIQQLRLMRTLVLLQVIYTATADDSLDTSAGVTFSLSEGSDAALSIDASTGAVTLASDADYEDQTSYSFTVVASDGVMLMLSNQ